MRPTLLVWHRFGKERGEEEFHVNPPEVVAEHLSARAALFRGRTAPDNWRWFQMDDTLIIERPFVTGHMAIAETRIFYLLKQGLAVIEDFRDPQGENWRWYIHLADFAFNKELECWVMKDMLVDMVIGPDALIHQVLDLDDLAQALDIRLVTPEKTSEILRRTESLVRRIGNGEFPFEEVLRGREACRVLGW